MKREWNAAEIEMLNISKTADGSTQSDNADADWTQIDGKWYLPGSGGMSPLPS